MMVGGAGQKGIERFCLDLPRTAKKYSIYLGSGVLGCPLVVKAWNL